MIEVSKNKILSDIGEKGILKDLIYPKFNKEPSGNSDQIGNDGSVLRIPQGKVIVATTDPCPTPVISLIEERDYYDYGWMLMNINVSDLAAMGASPLGLLSSTTMRSDMTISDYNRFLYGLSDAAIEFKCPVIGGNIREGKEFAAVGTAIGYCDPSSILIRTGARPGNLIVVVGIMGIFWAAVLSKLKNLPISQEFSELAIQALKRPMAKIGPGVSLARNHIVTSCMDSSDGISACLFTLAEDSKVDFIIDIEKLSPHPFLEIIANKLGYDPRKFMLSWGGWELVCTLEPKNMEAMNSICNSYGFPVQLIGQVSEGKGQILAKTSTEVYKLSDFGSYRFCNTSYLSYGLDSYLNFLNGEPLIHK